MKQPLNQIDKLLMQGFAYHQQGRFNEAKLIYEQALKIQPKNFSALQLIATLYAQINNPPKAIEFLTKAIRINPKFAPCYSNLGNVYKELGQYSDALSNYEKALNLHVDDALTHSNRGVVLQELGRTSEALESFDKAININPNLPETYSNRGVVLQELGRTSEALENFDKAINLKSDFGQAHFNRANLLYWQGRFQEALQAYNQVIRYDPNNAEAHFNRGNALKDLGNFEQALASYKVAIDLNPNWAEAFCNIGNSLHELRQFDQAVISFNKAIQFKPDFAEAHFNLGNALQELGKLDAALLSYEKAIHFSPLLIDAYSNKGLVLEKLKRIGDAINSYDEAIQIDPNLANVHFNKALTLLLSGDFQKGWDEYEWRWQNNPNASKKIASFNQPRWFGNDSIKDKTIFLFSEQGLGDTIQFCRYVTLISGLGAKIILEVQPQLVELLRQLNGINHLITVKDKIPSFDYYCPLLSLPLAFKTTLTTIPNNIPYIKADAKKVFYWQRKLEDSTRPRVGLVWNGGFRPDQTKLWTVNERRNIPLPKLVRNFNHLPINFYSLQKGDPAESEIRLLQDELWPNGNFFNYSNEIKDFSDTAALIENLDLIISVDTSTAHLAAAMGKPVWLLNRFDTCWRWLLDTEHSPWYPTVKIYRQEKINDWDTVLGRVKSDLVNCNWHL